MKFIIDAQLPFGLCKLFKIKGHDAIHTDDLPKKERTSDIEICKIAVEQNRIVITKDSDFLDSYLLNGIPQKLLLITTGNIKNKMLFDLFEKNFDYIIEIFTVYNLVELSNDDILSFD